MASFLFASDSFKGTLSSADTARMLGTCAERHFPGCDCVAVPMADGGEGTTEALVAACGGTFREMEAKGPLGRQVIAKYGLLGQGRAVIELAAASGLPLVDEVDRDPMIESSFGTGQLIADALDQGCTDISIALGGSATVDGGMGMARALGVRFLDANGDDLEGYGADLARVASVDVSGIREDVADVTFHAMCDVDSPLTGRNGAARVFGPQKGADPDSVERLESGMRSYGRLLERIAPGSTRLAGAGAAGGAGAACLAFLGADVISGVRRVLELVDFDRLLDGVDVCFTGEGHLDSQTERGKVISGVAAACLRRGVPCVAIVGGMSEDVTPPAGVSAVVPLAVEATSLDDMLACADRLYGLAADRAFSLVSVGAAMGGASGRARG